MRSKPSYGKEELGRMNECQIYLYNSASIQLIPILSLWDMRMKKGEERHHLIQLPIVKAPPKNNIPLMDLTNSLRNKD